MDIIFKACNSPFYKLSSFFFLYMNWKLHLKYVMKHILYALIVYSTEQLIAACYVEDEVMVSMFYLGEVWKYIAYDAHASVPLYWLLCAHSYHRTEMFSQNRKYLVKTVLFYIVTALR
jgi:hypothetical protein